MKRQILSTLALSIATAFGSAYASPVSGIETQHIDPTVRAQDDFYQYLNGGWIKTAEIPADRSSWGSFAKLREDTVPQVQKLIEAAQTFHEAGKITDCMRLLEGYWPRFLAEYTPPLPRVEAWYQRLTTRPGYAANVMIPLT